MFANERQEKILEMLKEKGAVTTSFLTKNFEVSVETVRRDLLQMERKNLLKRVHGGAVTMGEMRPLIDLDTRNHEYEKEKNELCEKAVKFIEENDIICIDAGSTAVILCRILKEKFSFLTVITNSMDVFNSLCDYKNFNVILCGGNYKKSENALYGQITLEALDKLYLKKAFIFPTAISLKYGLCDYDFDLCQIQKKMISSADEVFILGDNSKFEKRALIKFDNMNSEYTYISDNSFSNELKKLYKENNINIF